MKRRKYFLCIAVILCTLSIIGTVCYAYETDVNTGRTKIEDSKAGEEKEAAMTELPDGEYTIPVELKGGSGRVSVTSPAVMIIKNGTAQITIIWSSSNYDYIISGGKVYEPMEEKEFSTFQIPVLSFDEPMTVIADTTAMSIPYEIEYQLVLDTDGIIKNEADSQVSVICWIFIIAATIVVGSFLFLIYKNKKR